MPTHLKCLARRIGLVVTILAVGLVLDGCQLLDKVLDDFYEAIAGVSDGVNHEVVAFTFGNVYCTGSGRFKIHGQFMRQESFLEGMTLFAEHKNWSGGTLSTQEFYIPISEDGKFNETFDWNNVCVDGTNGEWLRFSVTPMGDIDADQPLKSRLKLETRPGF